MTTKNSVQDTVNKLTENELILAYEDVRFLREHEELPENCPLKRLEEYLSSHGEAAENLLEEVAECVLFRMADGFWEDLKRDYSERIGGWQFYGPADSLPVSLVHNAAETAMWDYCVFTDDVYGVPLSYFSTLDLAQDFISKQGYKCANDGEPIDY